MNVLQVAPDSTQCCVGAGAAMLLNPAVLLAGYIPCLGLNIASCLVRVCMTVELNIWFCCCDRRFNAGHPDDGINI
jgi:hypothetical protein